jgi:hypothetical protein
MIIFQDPFPHFLNEELEQRSTQGLHSRFRGVIGPRLNYFSVFNILRSRILFQFLAHDNSIGICDLNLQSKVL